MQFAPRSETSVKSEVLHLSGRFDAYEEPRVKKWLDEKIMAGVYNLVIDLTQVNFLDSVALATLVRGMKESRSRGGDLYLYGMQQPVRIIFELTRMDKVFSIYESESQVMTALENES